MSERGSGKDGGDSEDSNGDGPNRQLGVQDPAECRRHGMKPCIARQTQNTCAAPCPLLALDASSREACPSPNLYEFNNIFARFYAGASA